MRVTAAEFPDLPTLTARLSALCGGAGAVTVLAREPNRDRSTFPAEIVTCRLADGRERRLLCKYAAGPGHDADGRLAGVAYEAEVYRRVLGPLGATTPHCHGASEGPAEGAWLVLDYLDGSEPLTTAEDRIAMPLAATWIGRFHAAAEARLARGPLPFLRVYNAAYYRGWTRQAAQAIHPLQARLPWLAALCRRLEETVVPLLDGPGTVIHGEYYPSNILVRGEAVFPIDWESAAVAAGEIDLASLTEDWPAATLRECREAYRRARWPEGAPAAFERRLAAGRGYLAWRWLAEPGEPPDAATSLWYCDQLRAAGEDLGLI